jgi:hypothetical protein
LDLCPRIVRDGWQQIQDRRWYGGPAGSAGVEDLAVLGGDVGDERERRASAQDAADLLYGLLSPELFLLLVRERGWSADRWEGWAYETLRSQLCVD